MTKAPLRTAAQALDAIQASEMHHLTAATSAFVCPYPNCGAYAQHRWGVMKDIDVIVGDFSYSGRRLKGATIHTALCTSCEQEVLFLDGHIVKPAASEAPAPNDDMPTEIAGEYAEAAAILSMSPRGAAALLRLAVQKLLPHIGATKRNIDEAIGELVGKGTITARVQTALDTLRVIGNEAVHPGVIDLSDDVDTATSLFILLNLIIEKAISEPRHADDMFAMIPPSKQAAITQRNDKAIASEAAKAAIDDGTTRAS